MIINTSGAGYSPPAVESIQIVDDNPENLAVLSLMLTQQGYEVRTAITGTLALKSARKHPPDLILLDIMMPEMNGYEVCQQLKADERTRDIPVIFLSVLGEMMDKVKAFAVGGVDYIAKPFEIDEGLARIQTHLSLRRLHRRLEEQNAQLQQEIVECVRVEEVLRETTHALGERVKELNCFYSISRLIETPGITLDEILQGAADLIPLAWQHPENTCARILLEEREFRTENYQESPWMQAVDIRVEDELSGAVEVYYLQEMPEGDKGPFLKEERHLLNSIAERMGSIAGRERAQKNIRRNEKYLAALEERERIGRELHDDLGQVMGYVNVQAGTALQRLENRQVDEAQGILSQLVEVTQGASADVRKYILGIRTKGYHPPVNFFAELEQFLDTQHQHYGMEAQVSLPDDWLDSPFSQEVEIQLMRIIQEALTNVRKHAGVAKARLLFTQHANEAQVIIEDEGCGFDKRFPPGGEGDGHSPAGEGDEGHFGLTIMRERAESVGGSLEVRSIPDECTQVIVRVPVMLESVHKDELVRGIRVLLVDDHPLYLEGLRNLLASRGFQVIGQAHDGLEALEKTRALHPDLILMDVQMPGLDGVAATRRIKAEFPEVKIVMLTMGSEEETLFAALKNGASGYLLKSMAGNQFFRLLTKALGGETVLSPSLASQVLLEFAHQRAADVPGRAHPILTSRQQEVLELAAEGLSNKEIAAELNLSENTVKYHITQILDRLQLKSRHEFGSYLNGERE